MDKYRTIKVGTIITSIGIKTSVSGYSEKILETFLPDDNITKRQETFWTKQNNKRMEAICKFLNENDL